MGRFTQILGDLDASGNLRRLPELEHSGKYVVADGMSMLNFSSNDYLGIGSEENGLMSRFMDDIKEEKYAGLHEDTLLSSVSSRLLTGNFSIYGRLEAALCRLSGKEAALVFSSGYHMNTGILPAVSDRHTVILADKLVHASIIDGIRLSGALSVRFRHQDMDQLEMLVSKYSGEYGRIIIVTESIFSMDGDVTDLRRLVAIKRIYPEVMLYVDEAHAIGVRGEMGMGVAEEQGVVEDMDFLCGTFGKAVASVGAYLLCSEEIRELLVNRMRTLIFTTALPPLNVLWTLYVLEHLPDMSGRRRSLAEKSSGLIGRIRSAGIDCPSDSHIIPFMAGDSHKAIELSVRMKKTGFYLLPVRPPTVPEGTSRLRISLTASFTDEEVSALADALMI